MRSRKVYHYDPEEACFSSVKHHPENNKEGHFELFTKPANKYFFVEGFNPSGIKDAIVVGKNEA
jgi:hypothetical protein